MYSRALPRAARLLTAVAVGRPFRRRPRCLRRGLDDNDSIDRDVR